MKNYAKKLSDKIRALPLGEGRSQTALPYLSAYRFTDLKFSMPQTENAYLYIVLDGSIRLYTPSGIMDYAAGQYSVSAIDIPSSGCVLSFSERRDLLTLAVEFTRNDVISIVLDMDNGLAEQIMEQKLENQVMTQSDQNVIRSAYRLVSILDEPVPPAFMGRQLRREMIFYALLGSCGKSFLQSIINLQQAGEIYELNSWIKENFRDSFTVEELAEQRSMSVSLLHQKFKSAVGMGPLQCQKRLRLTEARRLMLDESKNVTEAALDVGYESVSQFTRDYRKMFGQAPKEDLRKLREQLKKQADFLQEPASGSTPPSDKLKTNQKV